MPDPLGDDALRDLLDEDRRREATARRRRRHWLDQQARAGTTLTGVLVDAAERGAHVTIATLAGTSVRGVVAHVGGDAVVVDGEGSAARHLVALAHATVLHLGGDSGEPQTTGDRRASEAGGMVAVLQTLVDEGGPGAAMPSVVVGLVDRSTVRGHLWLAGEDVVGVRSEEGRTAYLPIAAIAQVTW